MKLTLLFSIVVISLLGCASSTVWHLNGRSEGDLKSAGAQCEMQAGQGSNMGAAGNQIGYGVGSKNPYSAAAGILDALVQSAQQSDAFDQCMERYGFRKADLQPVGRGYRDGSDLNSKMACYTDSDCARGYSCRSISGGGAKCRAR